MGRDHSIECPKCGTSYGGLNGPDEHSENDCLSARLAAVGLRKMTDSDAKRILEVAAREDAVCDLRELHEKMSPGGCKICEGLGPMACSDLGLLQLGATMAYEQCARLAEGWETDDFAANIRQGCAASIRNLINGQEGNNGSTVGKT